MSENALVFRCGLFRAVDCKRSTGKCSVRRGLLPGPSITLDKLTFAYDEADKPVLDHVDLEIPGGALVALVGPSGAGKTTLMRLILGLLTPGSGRILIDGTPLNGSTLSGWRARVGAVLQNDWLLARTIADNIAFFDSALDQNRIEQAAKMAEIDTDIAKMPMAYESLIGDMGAALSSGQRQRIFLAHALYRDPDVLFLDEGTANLDPEAETRIADMITGLPMTRIVITHRPALAERADYVLTLTDGKIVSTPSMCRKEFATQHTPNSTY